MAPKPEVLPRAAILMLAMLLTAVLKLSLLAIDMTARTPRVKFLRCSALRFPLFFLLFLFPEEGAHQLCPRGCPRKVGMVSPVGFRGASRLSDISTASRIPSLTGRSLAWLSE